jgi:hypothetical protein
VNVSQLKLRSEILDNDNNREKEKSRRKRK